VYTPFTLNINYMLIRGTTTLDISEPKTEVELQVVKRMSEIIEKYELEDGGLIRFAYPKRFLIPNPAQHVKENKNKIMKPRSLKIILNDVVRSRQGTIGWRYCNSVTQVKDNKQRFNPEYIFFNGELSLGIKDIELIYYFLDLYSRTEGGKNQDKNIPPYIVLVDYSMEAETYNSEKAAQLTLDNALFGPEGLALRDDLVRALAGAVHLPAYETTKVSILKKTLHQVLSRDLPRAVTLISGLVGGDVMPELTALAKDLFLYKVVIVKETKVGRNISQSVVVNDDGAAGEAIIKLSGKKSHEEQLANVLLQDIETRNSLSEKLDAAKVKPEAE